MPETPRPIINYSGRDFATIKEQLSAFVTATRPELWTDFFEANLGTTLIELIAFVGDLVSYGQDVQAQETWISTARRRDSALRFARSVGYPFVSSRAAQVVVSSQATLPTNLVTNGGVISAGAFIVGANKLRYEVLEDVIIAPGTSQLTVTLREGQSFAEVFTPTQDSRQEFVTSRGVVEQDSWTVFVGDPDDPANEWQQVADVTLEPGPTQTYQIFFDNDGKLHVTFGDDNNGKIPTADITIRYRTCSGNAGNSAKETINGSFQVDIIALTTTVSIAVTNSGGPAAGGADRQTVEDLRVTIPAFMRTVDLVRSLLDYEEGVTALAGVALAFADVPLASFSGNIVRTHIWDTELISFVSTSPESGISSTSPYNRYVQAPTSRLPTVQAYLRPRTICTVHNLVVRPTVAQVDLFLGRVTYNRALFDQLRVHQDIVDAVVQLFAVTATGFAIRIADVYDAVLAVPGVKHFQIERIVFEHIDFDNPPAILIEDFRRDIDLPGDFGGPFPPIQDLVIPGATDRAYYDDAFLFDNEVVYQSEIDNPNIQAINLRTLTFDLRNG